ncbi:MAG: toprim domain-containing protein, partial [Candidatus Aenigmarchaeota archaeon]|nr:toprim domain-containing protein [Candidatus Aenigmarchaeota archaeon]
EVKVSGITEYGPDKLPAGPGVRSSESVIIVEGRADVLNLLKNGMDNVIALGGANVPKTAVNLCKQKEATLFLDGDRGGDIILKELMSVADIDFVARAPDGKEVEELSRKELIKALRSRVPVEQAEKGRQEYRGRPKNRRREHRPTRGGMSSPAPAPRQAPRPIARREAQRVVESAPPVPEELYKSLSELENTARARLYDANNNLKNEILVKDILPSIESASGVHGVVFDGVVTQRLVELAAKKGIKILLGVKVGNVFNRPAGITIGEKK